MKKFIAVTTAGLGLIAIAILIYIIRKKINLKNKFLQVK